MLLRTLLQLCTPQYFQRTHLWQAGRPVSPLGQPPGSCRPVHDIGYVHAISCRPRLRARSVAPYGLFILVVACYAALSAVTFPQALAAQRSAPLEYISQDPYVIQAQLEVGARLAELALAALDNPGEVEQLKKAGSLAAKSYIHLRYAMHGIELLQSNSSRGDGRGPLLATALTATNQARERNLAARTAIDNSIPWPEIRNQYIAEAIRGLKESIPPARRAASILK